MNLGWLFCPPILLDMPAVEHDRGAITAFGGVIIVNSIRKYEEM